MSLGVPTGTDDLMFCSIGSLLLRGGNTHCFFQVLLCFDNCTHAHADNTTASDTL